jgi:hypothetical protein
LKGDIHALIDAGSMMKKVVKISLINPLLILDPTGKILLVDKGAGFTP